MAVLIAVIISQNSRFICVTVVKMGYWVLNDVSTELVHADAVKVFALPDGDMGVVAASGAETASARAMLDSSARLSPFVWHPYWHPREVCIITQK